MLDATVDLFPFLITSFHSEYSQGFNPMICYTFSPTSNHTDIYQVTQGGFVIAKTSDLEPKQKHVLEVNLRKKQQRNCNYNLNVENHKIHMMLTHVFYQLNTMNANIVFLCFINMLLKKTKKNKDLVDITLCLCANEIQTKS